MPVLVFDTETTNLIQNSAVPLVNQPYLLEFCGILIDDQGSTIDELEFRCNPGVPIPKMASKINGIYDADVQDLPPFAHHLEDLKRLFRQAKAIVAHNLSYDFRIMQFEFARNKEVALEAKTLFNAIPARICTIEETMHLKGYRLSLAALHQLLFGEDFPNAHRAKVDVEALIRCYVELVKRGQM